MKQKCSAPRKPVQECDHPENPPAREPLHRDGIAKSEPQLDGSSGECENKSSSGTSEHEPKRRGDTGERQTRPANDTAKRGPLPPNGSVQHETYTGRVGGLLSVASTRRLSSPPRRAFRSNDGKTVHEDLVLSGCVSAPRTARETLDLYGIDMSCAKYDRLEGRWSGCLFSEQVADMLVELAGEGEFPYAFEALPTWAELEWRVRQDRGETLRPELEVYMWTEPASIEAIEAFQKRTGVSLVRRGTPQEATGHLTEAEVTVTIPVSELPGNGGK